MEERISYLDLFILKKLDADSTVEKLGPVINTSFFETANLLGAMKIKGLIDIQSSIGGLSPIIVLPYAKDLISLAIKKASEPLNELDYQILSLFKKGVKELSILEKNLNVSSYDIAFHLYKLKSNGYITDQIQSARIFFSLTEKGFLLASEKLAKEPQQEKIKSDQSIQSTLLDQPAIDKEKEIEEEINYLIFDQKASPQQSLKKEVSHKEKPLPLKKKYPWEVEEKGIKLDRTKMFLSKLQYYIQSYALLLILTFFLLTLIMIALFVIFFK